MVRLRLFLGAVVIIIICEVWLLFNLGLVNNKQENIKVDTKQCDYTEYNHTINQWKELVRKQLLELDQCRKDLIYTQDELNYKSICTDANYCPAENHE